MVPGAETRSKTFSIAIIAFCQVAAMSLWFSASAVLPALIAEFRLTAFSQAALTSAVQLGFVAGCVLSALLGLPDRVDPRRLFSIAAAAGAIANAVLLVVAPSSPAALAARVVTGICMAGVYPVGMKLASTWAKGDMGLMVGILVGALTLGSASPHLFNAVGGIAWRVPLALSSIAAVVAAAGIHAAGIGPNRAPSPPVDPRAVLDAWRNVPLRLANLGYLGHMWELYAVWTWIAAFATASLFPLSRLGAAPGSRAGSGIAFVMIGSGAIGSAAAGWWADAIGKARIARWAMIVSGVCAAASGLVYGAPRIVLALFAIVWGVAVVADSAQLSALVAQYSPRDHVGTALTIQTCLGFLLTMASIRLVPLFAHAVGWQWAFLLLVPGPLFGAIALATLDDRRLS